MSSQWFQVPQMTSRRRVREVSAWISDVPGVRTVEARLDTATVHVTGTAESAAVEAAIRQAGYTATALPDGTPADSTPGDSATDHDGTRGGPMTSPAIMQPLAELAPEDRSQRHLDDPATSPDEVAP